MSSAPRFWAVVPAAGIGKRMGGEIPKQYLPLGGRMVIEHTLDRLACHPKVNKIVVSIAADDHYWKDVSLPETAEVVSVTGGAERCDSVFNGLEKLCDEAAVDDWVLVHDAARPCLRVADIETLMATLKEHPVGGILGLPVADTMKRSDAAGAIVETVSRARLWRALTPQMFRFGMLYDALLAGRDSNTLITDEASAIEWAGFSPCMVEGHADNIKITQPHDLSLATLYLQQQKEPLL
ncbi:MAG: 2-C-methyl-D-erythritol 4-phosphate cytidylyltransferase [Gammaproteobacteria bacterium]|nr:2-C-methyl-D-erythritol 4-phosphate cytidylyltransferase [Gammaproteobacteria bacterium]MCF6230783.1 2-C-methyl-D-erythritol 4-phosphate cytidylyltransferase [Gammaproteobacteria bacterium]